MCLHSKGDLNWFLKKHRDENSYSAVWFETKNGKVFATTCYALNDNSVSVAVEDLRRWHPELNNEKPNLSDVNKKRARKNLTLFVDTRPQEYAPDPGFETSGLSYPELLDRLRNYADRRVAA